MSAGKFRFREEVILDSNQRIALEVSNPILPTAKAYFTVVSRNLLTGAPIVIGPIDLHRDAWIALAGHCQEVIKLLAKRSYKNSGKGRSKTKVEIY